MKKATFHQRQKLYLHRNTLQYRIDRLRQDTGLNLRRMDDLVLLFDLAVTMDSFEWCGGEKERFATCVVYATVFRKSAQRLLNFLCNLC